MKYPETIKLDEPHFVVSLKHTHPKDKYLTLWRPDNKGYCWSVRSAGLYSEIIYQYHIDDGNVPVPLSELMKHTTIDDEGRSCIKNCKASRLLLDKHQKMLMAL